MMKFKMRKQFHMYKNRKGFTLVESIVMVLIFTILFGACVVVLSSGTDNWQANKTKLEINEELRKAMNRITEDLVQAGASTMDSTVPANGNSYNSATFNLATGISGGNITWSTNTVTYARGGTNSMQILRTSGTDSTVISSDISTLTFTRQASSSDVVEVSMAASKDTDKGTTITLTLNFKVYVRN